MYQKFVAPSATAQILTSIVNLSFTKRLVYNQCTQNFCTVIIEIKKLLIQYFMFQIEILEIIIANHINSCSYLIFTDSLVKLKF